MSKQHKISFLQALQNQIKQLLLNPKVKNRVQIGTFEDNEWQEVKLIVPLHIPTLSCKDFTQLKLLFRLCSDWPCLSPGLYIESQYISSQYWFTNIMETECLTLIKPHSIKQIVLKLIKEMDCIGFMKWVSKIYGNTKKERVSCKDRVNQIQMHNNYNINGKSNLNKYNKNNITNNSLKNNKVNKYQNYIDLLTQINTNHNKNINNHIIKVQINNIYNKLQKRQNKLYQNSYQYQDRNRNRNRNKNTNTNPKGKQKQINYQYQYKYNYEIQDNGEFQKQYQNQNQHQNDESDQSQSSNSSSMIFPQQNYMQNQNQNKQHKQVRTNASDLNNKQMKNNRKSNFNTNIETNINREIIHKQQNQQLFSNPFSCFKPIQKIKSQIILSSKVQSNEDKKIKENKSKGIIINSGFKPFRPTTNFSINTPKYQIQNSGNSQNSYDLNLNLSLPLSNGNDNMEIDENKPMGFTFFNPKIDNYGLQNQYQNLFYSNIDNQLNKSPKPMNKNANLPKFLIRIFIKYLDKYKQMYIKRQYDKLITQCKKMKEWKKNDRRQHAFGLKHLKIFFQDLIEGFPDPKMNRKVISKIIDNYLLQQICQNSQIPQSHRVGYLVACRVYSIRCRNAALAGRIQSK